MTSPDNVTHIRALANKWKRATTNKELLELIDYILNDSECPNCKEAIEANRRRQTEWRERKKARLAGSP